jgi:pimeloyl-ACP methyl ester carboxylesterase
MPSRGRHQTTCRECKAVLRRIEALEGVGCVIIGRSYGGKSLGAANYHRDFLTNQTAHAQPGAPWKALVVVASFDSFPAVIQGQAVRHSGVTFGPLWADATNAVYHWKSGIRLEDIQPTRHAAFIRIPTLIAHGTADEVISIDSGRRLFDSLPADITKKWVEIPGAGHENVLVTDYQIYADIAEWMLQHVTGP